MGLRIRLESIVRRVRLHVEAAARRVEKSPHDQQPVLGASGYKRKRRFAAEYQAVMRSPQPFHTLRLRLEQDAKRLVDAEHRRDPQQRVEWQSQLVVRAC